MVFIASKKESKKKKKKTKKSKKKKKEKKPDKSVQFEKERNVSFQLVKVARTLFQ